MNSTGRLLERHLFAETKTSNHRSHRLKNTLENKLRSSSTAHLNDASKLSHVYVKSNKNQTL